MRSLGTRSLGVRSLGTRSSPVAPWGLYHDETSRMGRRARIRSNVVNGCCSYSDFRGFI